jgi:hypothetical protein
MLYTADDDPELREWIDYQSANGGHFVRSVAKAAGIASMTEYFAIRPSLVRLRAQHPEPGATVRTVITDAYKVTYVDSERVDEIQCAFNRFNGTIFDNRLPESSIRFASSIQNLCVPGSPLGLLALPEDPVSHLVPGQPRLKIPHIFISDRLRGVSPLDEWVLLHEMCHFRFVHHGKEFIELLKSSLDKIEWSVLVGGH